MTAVRDGITAWQEIEHFYRREASLLQSRRYREWLEQFTDDVSYRVPIRISRPEGPDDDLDDERLGYYDEDAAMLVARVEKLESKLSWSEQPASRVRYFVQLLDVVHGDRGDLTARSNVLLFQHRWNLEQFFTGDRVDRFVRVDGELKVGSRRVVLDRDHLGNQALSVFF